MVETRKDEIACRKFTKWGSDVKAINLKKSGFQIQLIKGFGMIDAISEIVGAPRGVSNYEITFKRKKSDFEMVEEWYQDIKEQEFQAEQDHEDLMMEQTEEIYQDYDGPDFDWPEEDYDCYEPDLW
jgi:hypothetical protein